MNGGTSVTLMSGHLEQPSRPNKSLQPTATAVMPPAAQEITPAVPWLSIKRSVMKLALRIVAVLTFLLALGFTLLALGMFHQAYSGRSPVLALGGFSIIVAAALSVRCVVWLWSGPSFWWVVAKRAEVAALAFLVLGWLVAAFYVPHRDANAPAKLFFIAEIVAIFAFSSVRFLSKRGVRPSAPYEG